MTSNISSSSSTSSITTLPQSPKRLDFTTNTWGKWIVITYYQSHGLSANDNRSSKWG